MNNIDFFNRFSLALFAKLYESFPSPVTIDPKDVLGNVLPADSKSSDWLIAAGDAMDFLSDEGFLTYKGNRMQGSGAALNVRLTMKGLAILGSTPDALGGHTPLIDRVTTTLKEGGSEGVKQLVQYVFAKAIAAGAVIVS
jgi:hypothetical protein